MKPAHHPIERIERQGEVIALGGGMAQIRLERPAGCSQCGSRGTCASSDSGGQILELRLNGMACVGDAVSISTPASALMQAALLGYLLPAVGLLAGALLGEMIVGGDLPAVIGAALGLIGGLVGARLIARLTLTEPLTPRVVTRAGDPVFQSGESA